MGPITLSLGPTLAPSLELLISQCRLLSDDNDSVGAIEKKLTIETEKTAVDKINKDGDDVFFWEQDAVDQVENDGHKEQDADPLVYGPYELHGPKGKAACIQAFSPCEKVPKFFVDLTLNLTLIEGPR